MEPPWRPYEFSKDTPELSGLLLRREVGLRIFSALLAKARQLIAVLVAFHVAEMTDQFDQVALIEFTIALPLHGSGV